MNEETVYSAIAIMLAAGTFGGVVNYYYYPRKGDIKNFFPKCIIVGLGASFLVPLFLKLIQSKLFDDLSTQDPKSFFIFGGFCLFASITSFKFISTLSDKVYKELEEVKQEASENRKRVEQAKDSMRAMKEVIAQGQASPDMFKQVIDNVDLSAIDQVSDDPQKGQWGGKRKDNDREIKAELIPIDDDDDWYRIKLTVSSTSPSKPLSGRVKFHLHPTFKPRVREVPVVNGIAEETVIAWGAFTIGAEADNGETRLEIDLADKDIKASDKFKSR